MQKNQRAFTLPRQHERCYGPCHAVAPGVGGFTLAEMLVAIGVLVLIVLFVTQIVNGAARIMTLGHKRIDSDSQARQLLDRLAVDFDQWLKRTDVNCYFKAATPSQPGNDQMAFFTSVAGHSPQTAYESEVSLVAYRVNADPTTGQNSASYDRLERLGKQLPLNAAGDTTATPLVFIDSGNSTTIQNIWPAATVTYPNANYNDADYELIGPQVFRFEYYYLLDPSGPSHMSGLNRGDLWANNSNLFKIKDIAAIVVAVGVIDSRSRVLLSKSNIEKLAGTNGQTSPFVDFTSGTPGQLVSTWQNALTTDPAIAAMPRPAIQGIRFYERYFYLNK